MTRRRIFFWRRHLWRLWGYREGKDGDNSPKGIVTNGRMGKGNLNIAQCGALGKQPNMWEICTYMFELGAVRLVQVYQILYQM